MTIDQLVESLTIAQRKAHLLDRWNYQHARKLVEVAQQAQKIIWLMQGAQHERVFVEYEFDELDAALNRLLDGEP